MDKTDNLSNNISLYADSAEQIEKYWLQKLVSISPLNFMVNSNQSTAIHPVEFGMATREFNAALFDRLNTISTDYQLTFDEVILSAFAVLLKAYGNSEDVNIVSSICTPSSVKRVFPLQLNIENKTSFKTVCNAVRNQVNTNTASQDSFDFKTFIENTTGSLPADVKKVFQVVFINQHSAKQENNFVKYLSVKNIHPEIILQAQNSSKQISISYRKDLFDDVAVEKMMDNFFQLFHSIANNPLSDVGLLNILTEQERHIVVEEFNKAPHEYPADKTLIDLFEEQVKKRPDDVVLIFNGIEFTYSALNLRANQLAGYLKTVYAIHTEDFVGIMLERSEWMIISILAALKAGAAYVPIDPSLNESRIKYLVEDSRCKILINQDEINKFKTLADNYSSGNHNKSSQPHNLAYVIYTSGSTGNPKGVMVENRGVVNRIEWMFRHYNYSENDVILQKTTFTFDVSVWEIFMPLCWGPKMVLCQKEDIAAPRRIINLIKKYKVSCLHFVPGMLNAFLAAFDDDKDFTNDIQTLRCVITSGEALSVELVKKWYQKSDIPIYNLYGPTEASVDVTYYDTKKDDLKIPIGKPIWNTQIYIVNELLQPVPIGVTGEICIAGDGLARGYLNKRELTNQKFISNPFDSTKKMYLTGDYGRWLHGGDVEYLGRKDDQVKIRGYRIELGEIENAIHKYKSIKEAVVLAKADDDDNKNLIAYVVVKKEIDLEDFRDYLKKLLPDYMLPSAVVELPGLPLNSSGKIDKKSLATRQVSASGFSSVVYQEPSTDTEKTIAAIWKDVLKTQRISVYDNFFNVGGHSLIAIKLMTRLEKATGVRLPLAILFECPTIKQLAHRIDNKQIQEWECLVPIKPAGSKPPVYIVHGVGGHVLLMNLLVKYVDPQQPIYGLQPKGMGGKGTIPDTIEELAQVYINEILQQNPEGPYALAGFSFGGIVAFEITQQLKAMGKEVKMLALFDSYLGQVDFNESSAKRVWNDVSFAIMKRMNTPIQLLNNPKHKIEYEKRRFKEWLVKRYQKLSWMTHKPGEKKSHMYYIYKIRERLNKARANYHPSVYKGDVHLFRATIKTFYAHDYKYLGWKPFVDGEIFIHEIESDHEGIFQPPQNKHFAAELQACLNAAFADKDAAVAFKRFAVA